MKRLLTYLFIVLGLGLVFSVNVEAKTIPSDIYFCEASLNYLEPIPNQEL